MIHNEMRPCRVLSHGLDAFGQSYANAYVRTIDMCLKPYQLSNTGDIRFTNVEYVGLTEDHDITDANTLEIDGVMYEILYVIPANRYYQVLCRKQ